MALVPGTARDDSLDTSCSVTVLVVDISLPKDAVVIGLEVKRKISDDYMSEIPTGGGLDVGYWSPIGVRPIFSTINDAVNAAYYINGEAC
ncbi:hypothetical protein AOL_s00088g32 [Orbilia oligospora ATCC 24927]|uniref:Uncharacterized protein n=2 Tax=Orbilia oligospora TaxID=2813651 RepID=G1XHR9_ARTOA|nr:hypothetical protein AOL_s00088g32 [Orbilia oligospora ATCC 24927]EGX47317.1 hypothetical protein AOL_s00088g32 [Orbilia oligospora ATCC 24927]